MFCQNPLSQKKYCYAETLVPWSETFQETRGAEHVEIHTSVKKKKVENKNMQTVKHTRLLEYGVLFRKKIKRNEMKAYFVQKFN